MARNRGPMEGEPKSGEFRLFSNPGEACTVILWIKSKGGKKKTYSILLFRLEGGVPSFPRTAPLTVFPAARTCTTDAPDKHADINMVKFSVR